MPLILKTFSSCSIKLLKKFVGGIFGSSRWDTIMDEGMNPRVPPLMPYVDMSIVLRQFSSNWCENVLSNRDREKWMQYNWQLWKGIKYGNWTLNAVQRGQLLVTFDWYFYHKCAYLSFTQFNAYQWCRRTWHINVCVPTFEHMILVPARLRW